MRVKEWHRIMVQGQEVYHDLEPTYYRQGKTNVRIQGIWYCAECDEIVNMRRLDTQGLRVDDLISGKYTSMFEKGLRFGGKQRLLEARLKKISNVKESMPKGQESTVAACVGHEEPHIVPSPSPEAPSIVASPPQEKYPGTPRSAPCPCGSGKKYKRCCGVGAMPL